MRFSIIFLFFAFLSVFCFFISCKQSDSSPSSGDEGIVNEPDNTTDVKKVSKEEISRLVEFKMIEIVNKEGGGIIIGKDENWSGFYSGVEASQKGVFVSEEKKEDQINAKQRAFQKSEETGESGERDESEDLDGAEEAKSTTRIVKLRPYSIGKYEVTQELYGGVMGKNPSYCRDNPRYPLLDEEGTEEKKRPVENVSWYDAVLFCNELTKLLDSQEECVYYSDENFEKVYEEGDKVFYNPDKKGYRLPTEAEWEFAARGGNAEGEAFGYAYAGGNTDDRVSFATDTKDKGLDAYGWYKYNLSRIDSDSGLVEAGQKGYGTHVVGKKKANSLGIFDMSGNVREWCYDIYDGNPCSHDKEYVKEGEESVIFDPRGPATGSQRVCRGGSYLREAYVCSVAYRASYPPNKAISSIGFRLAKSL